MSNAHIGTPQSGVATLEPLSLVMNEGFSPKTGPTIIQT